MSYSDFLENAVQDHIFLTAPYPQPTNLYIALYTVAPTDAGGGTEVTGGSYARVVNNAWDTSVGGATMNSAIITFPTATANWGTVVAVGIFDAITGGNLLVHTTLTTPQAVNTSATAAFGAGAIDVTLA